ncbi:MAG: STAS domain-containing protein [Myxococcaceae bacterium]
MLSLVAIDGSSARLTGALDVGAMKEAKPLLTTACAGGVRRLDLSGLELIDTAGVQLLHWLKTYEVKDLALVGAPKAVVRTFALIGLEKLVSP